VAVEAVSAASVEPIYAWFGIRSTAFCNFISNFAKGEEIQGFEWVFLPSKGIFPPIPAVLTGQNR